MISSSFQNVTCDSQNHFDLMIMNSVFPNTALKIQQAGASGIKANNHVLVEEHQQFSTPQHSSKPTSLVCDA